VPDTLTPAEAAEERRLWADYYEAMERVIEIIRREGTAQAALPRIVAEDAIASRAIARIKQLHRLP
jgi:small-conductance mechanosensitive channel